MQDVICPSKPLISLHTPSTSLSWLADKADQALRIRSDSELIDQLGWWLCEVHKGCEHSVRYTPDEPGDTGDETPCHVLQTARGRCLLRIHQAGDLSTSASALAQALVRICQSRLDQMTRLAAEGSSGHHDPAQHPMGPQDRAFARAVQEGLTHAAMTEAPMACLLLELVDESTDASTGHTGDLTRRLRNRLRKHDALFELSQGRWGLLLHRMGQPDTVHAVVRRLQHALRHPEADDSGALRLGLALYPRDGRSATELLHKARTDVRPLLREPSAIHTPASDPTVPGDAPVHAHPVRHTSWH